MTDANQVMPTSTSPGAEALRGNPAVMTLLVTEDAAGQTLHRQRTEAEIKALKETLAGAKSQRAYWDSQVKHLEAELKLEEDLKLRTRACENPRTLAEPAPVRLLDETAPCVIKTVAKKKRGPDKCPRKKRGSPNPK